MEEQRQQLQFLFGKFADSVIVYADNDLNIRCFTEKQIESITDNYNTVLGKGGFSVVYKGRFDDGRSVAVKKYISTSKKKEFTKEVIIQSQFSHRNIIRLLGCCVEADAPMLVTEFAPNGNLSDFLFLFFFFLKQTTGEPITPPGYFIQNGRTSGVPEEVPIT